jgi:hypothetical protein
MDIKNQQKQPDDLQLEQGKRSKAIRFLLNGAMGLLIVLVGYLSYAFIFRSAVKPDEEHVSLNATKIIQMDVLNGCGVNGIGAKFTGYLRQNGFDVVEMKNYKTSNVPHTLVIDRVGNLSVAKRVAFSLGIPEKNIIQQLNPDYFVDVSVVIGEDYQTLRPHH